MPPFRPRASTSLLRAAHLALFGLPVAAGLLSVLPGQAVAQSASQQFQIAAGPLGTVLSLFATRAGITLSFDARDTQGRQSSGLQGAYSVEEGLARLLAGSGLRAQRRDNGGYVLVPAANAGSVELGATSIDGQFLGETTEHSGSYTSGVTRTATKLPLTIRETPQSITVVTRQQMDDQGAQSIADVLRNTPGVSAQSYDSDRTEFSSRGLVITNYQYDGVNSVYDGVYNEGVTHVDMAIYDRVEVLKGATGLMTGSGDPSATVNLIRKKPTGQFQASLTGSAGSWDNYRGEGDISGPLNQSGSLRGRFVGAKQDGNGYQDHYQMKKEVWYGILEADLGPQTLLTVGVDQQTTTPRGTSWTGNPVYFSDGTRTDFSRSFNPGADWSRRDFQSRTFFASLEQALANDWSLKLSLNQMQSDHDTRLASASGGNPDRATGDGMFFYWGRWEGHRVQNNADLSLSGPFSLLGREHDLVLGFNSTTSRQTGDTYDTSLFAMVPGSIYDWRGDIAVPVFPKNGKYEQNKRQNGAYIATRLKPVDDLSLILGTRVSTFKYDETYNYDGLSPSFPDSQADYEQHGVVTPYAGIVYDLDDIWSVYASYTSIYQPQTYKDSAGSTLDPVEGKSYETGLKAAFLGGRLNASLALFRIEQDNVAQSIGTNPLTNEGIYKAIDGATTKGVELEIAGEPLDGWNLGAGYTYARTRDADEQRIFGFPMSTSKPEHLLRLFSTYRLPGALERVTVGGGLNWQSAFYGNIWNPASNDYSRIKQGGYTLVDLMTRYQHDEHLSFTLNANNVFDKRYLSGLGNFDTTWYGEPRNLMLTTRWDF
ncbi:TonB-dependent siderophore receptor [Pseudomonas japonica]|uniref:Outer-membrane receptor for ferric coprogen and ferric-rhodotorulic acid n=1 Tax=Pseudomonas japonica TaxID=256466 RepID=A0A239E572_9PSED|nr:TonB-dependent receptor [Pseudomonas japonica]SNS39826.1 outer-membrane receptor for ferric coprogen and ferric-rhodotorulic acid [Pseudomonas japonica]